MLFGKEQPPQNIPRMHNRRRENCMLLLVRDICCSRKCFLNDVFPRERLAEVFEDSRREVWIISVIAIDTADTM